MATVLIKRGTRAQLNAAAAASGLKQGELYLITDESTLAVGVSVSAYIALGTLATQNANAVAITGGAISGVTLSASSVTATGLTSGRIPVAGTGGLLGDSKLSDDGTTPRYDGNAIYHEGNPPPAGDTFPAGAIVAYGGAAAPDGWLLCDGSAVSRTTLADLFAVLGTSHGAGDGSTTFNLPDLRDRFVRGKGAASVVGDTGGAATHDHAVGLAVGTNATNARETGDTLTPDASPVSGHLTVDHYHSSSVNGDTGSASSLPPYLVEVWIIKASGTPSASTPHNTLSDRSAAGAHPASSISFTPTGTISATTVQAAIEEVAAEAGAGGGSPLTVKEWDGTPSVANVTELRFSGATVTDNGAGAVTVTVTSGGGATSPASALYLHSTFGGF